MEIGTAGISCLDGDGTMVVGPRISSSTSFLAH
jgi:hypothetical protein